MSQKRAKAQRRNQFPDMVKTAKRNAANEHVSTTQLYLLKWIACIIMLIDHIAVFFQEQCSIPPDTYMTMRYIGRMAFPMFAYLLVESFHHTKSRGKHLFRIGLLAVISEYPYDFIFMTERGIVDWTHQNVCVSLFLAFLCLMFTNRSYDKLRSAYKKPWVGKLVEGNLKICITALFCVLGLLAKVDLSYAGILLVAILAFARSRRHRKPFQFIGFLVYGLLQAHIAYILVVVPLVLIWVFEEYHKKHEFTRKSLPQRFICGKFMRRLSGIFYPLHMVVLIIVRIAMAW